METNKELGWIESVTLGFDSDNIFGLHLGFKGAVYSTATSIYCGKQPDSQQRFALRLREVMEEAGARSVEKLKGKPIEMTFEGHGMARLTEWRILTEVIPK